MSAIWNIILKVSTGDWLSVFLYSLQLDIKVCKNFFFFNSVNWNLTESQEFLTCQVGIFFSHIIEGSPRSFVL